MENLHGKAGVLLHETVSITDTCNVRLASAYNGVLTLCLCMQFSPDIDSYRWTRLV